MPSPDEQASGGKDVAVAPQRYVCRAATDVEMEKRLLRVAPRERGTAPLECQPRFQAGIVGRGHEGRPEALANCRHEPAGILPPRGEPREERAAAADVGVAGCDSAAGEPVVDEAERGGEIEPVVFERGEDEW